MAQVQSLGLQEPSALPYLIAESILPAEPSSELYNWHTYGVFDEEGRETAEEEVLTTRQCVVWSRSRVVRRVYNLDIEGEAILQAFVASFPAPRKGAVSGQDTRPAVNTNAPAVPRLLPDSSGTPVQLTRTLKEQPDKQGHELHPAADQGEEASERALVVILRSQAHMYYLSGDSHVIPLPFEVGYAWPTARGFLLQRRLSTLNNTSSLLDKSLEPLAASRSYQASRLLHLHKPDNKKAPRPSLMVTAPPDHVWQMPATHDEGMPRMFSFTEPQSELGLVTVDDPKQTSTFNTSSTSLHVLGEGEEIIYVSSRDECKVCGAKASAPLHIAVTLNAKANTYTVWEVKFYTKHYFGPPHKRRKLDANGHEPRRRSSNVFGRATGTATPTGRGHGHLRESFGAIAQSQAENIQLPGHEEKPPSQMDQLAEQLGSDFGDVGIQTRAARRVSSMLARTDLSMGPDRHTFNDLAHGQPARKSLGRSVRRGESMGGFSDRQSFGARRRSSLPGNNSMLSTGTSFLDAPLDSLLENFNTHGDIEGFDSMGIDDTISELPREVAFTKIKNVSRAARASMSPNGECSPQVFTVLAPKQSVDDPEDMAISVCIMDRREKELTIIDLIARRHSAKGSQSNFNSAYDLKRVHAQEFRKGSSIVDACKLGSGMQNRILTLRQSRDGQSTLQLEAPGSTAFTLELPSQLLVYDPFNTSLRSSPDKRRETGLRRVMKQSSQTFIKFNGAATQGQISLLDKDHNAHKIRIRLDPANAQVKAIVTICNFVLGDRNGPGMLICWWEALRWLKTRAQDVADEWTAVVIVLFSMAVPFIDDTHNQSPVTQRRKKTGLLRSSSGTAIDMASWETMVESEISSSDGTPAFMASAGWNWMMDEKSDIANGDVTGTHLRPKPLASASKFITGKKNTFLVRCAALAREFLQTPAGEGAIGPEGYLPVAVNRDPEHRRGALANILLGLHLLREEQKLDIRRSHGADIEAGQLTPILAQLGIWMGWDLWSYKAGCLYGVDIGDADVWLFEESQISTLNVPAQPFAPPSIFAYAERCFQQSPVAPFLTLLDVLGKPKRPDRSQATWREAQVLTPRTLALRNFFSQMHRFVTNTARVELLVKCGLTIQMLETLPDGIASPLHEAIVCCQAAPSPSWNTSLLELVDRTDLRSGMKVVEQQSTIAKTHASPTHEAQKDYHGIGNIASETDPFHTWDASSEADRQSITRLIFGDDRRYQEASKLVNQLRPPIAECSPEPEWTEADLLEAQKDLVYHVTRRTLAVSSGRGMMNYSARVPLLTEKVVVPAFTLQCVMKPKSGATMSFNAVTLSAEKAAFTEDKVCWAFFHNGVSSGLMISRKARGIDTSWILYNKPLELTNRHAGFLFALGLNGHLKSLAKWVAFKYLTPKHTMTSIGLLLGLSASYVGTMDTLITRLLSVHVTRLLPPGAAELNLSPMTQTAGIMGIGLLYCSSQHRRMSEVMLSEIENTDPEEGVSEEALLRDEGYRLAAGFSLGLINLGQGKRLHSLRDMSPVERLLSIAIGTKNINLVHVLDRATAGATIALALIFMKTEDESLASKIDVPDTIHQFDYVRPDLFLLRTVARHLILWSRIQPSSMFLQSSLPKAYRHRFTLRSTRYLSTEDMPFFNILAGICLAIGLRFAGTASPEVCDLLVAYLDQFMRLTRLPALNYDAKLARNSVRNCQDVVALAAAAVMAGTGDLSLLRRFRSLHGRVDAETPYGSHQAAHMAIGALFLGGGTHTFGTSNLAVASLLCAFYPVFPTTVLDNKSHLQAFRHFWVLAAEPRCIVPRDADTLRPISVPVSVSLRNGTERTITAPCLLPEFSEIATIETSATEHWEVVLDFTATEASTSVTAFEQNQSVFLRRRAAYDAPASSTFTSALQAVTDARPIPSVSTTVVAPYRYGQANNPLEWLFGLGAFRDLDVAEQALVLPSLGHGYANTGASSRERILSGTVVDARLELEKGILSDGACGGMASDGLWQLRLLFAWLDGLDRETQGASMNQAAGHSKGSVWLRREVVEALRWRVWQLAGGLEHGDGGGGEHIIR
jgi:anaphase-promoting complex subunit 1